MKNPRQLLLSRLGMLTIGLLIPLLASDSDGAESDRQERMPATGKWFSSGSSGAYYGYGIARRQPAQQESPVMVMSGESAAVFIPQQQPTALAAYSLTAGKWSLYTAPKGVRVTPITAGHVFGLYMAGEEIPELAAFSPMTGRWHSQKLDVPAKGLVHAAVGDWVIGINVNGRAYAFSGLTGSWDVTDIDAPVSVGKKEARTWSQGKTSVFSAETGKWTDIGDSTGPAPFGKESPGLGPATAVPGATRSPSFVPVPHPLRTAVPQGTAPVVPGVPRPAIVVPGITRAAMIKRSGGGVFDDFDGQLKVDWQLLRPDLAHISLSKHPGSLTISTQHGTIHLSGRKPKAKNILLLDNPFAKESGFVATTCLDGFRPREPFQQAGLIVYNDDDNYLKWVVEQTTSAGVPSRVAWNLLREDNGVPQMTKFPVEHDLTKKIWLRLTQREGQYEYATSTDEKDWTVHGRLPWGDGSPKQIGLLAKNGGMRGAESIDARFDFFELRPLTSAEANSEGPSSTKAKESHESETAHIICEAPSEADTAGQKSFAVTNEVEKRYAEAALRVSENALKRVTERNKEIPGSIPHAEIDRLQLAVKRARLKVEQLQKQSDSSRFNADYVKLQTRLYDGFDGKFTLNWEPVRPDPTHVSFTKNAGKLTITTQRGGIYGSVGPSAKNFYLIRNPLAEGVDFVLTTCIESFKPTLSWQQAGLLIYDDDDNYLKCDVEWSKSAVQFRYIRETDGEPVNVLDQTDVDQEHVWIRIMKRGNSYERSYSSDGENFVSAGAGDWGDGSPKWIGIFAKNGPNVSDGIDAVFDFFELRSLTPAEKERPSVAEPVVVPQTKREKPPQDDVKKASGPLMLEKGVQALPLASWCIRGDGLVLSQAHVSHERDGINPETGLIYDPWEPGHTVDVVLHDGRRLKAVLLGADYERDLSLLKIVENGDYPHLELSERPVKLGDWVLKVGHPHGYRSERGTVFRLGRVLYSGTLDIVADCLTSGGDSGGPLLDIDGEVVGIVGNSLIPQQIAGAWPEARGVSPMSYVPVPILHERIPAMLERKVVPRVGYGVHARREEAYENAEEFLAPRHWSQGEATRAAWLNVTEKTKGSVVEVLRQGERAAFGTVVDGEGHVVTKASEMGEAPQCRLPNGKTVDAEVSRTIAQFDLAILKVAIGQLRPVRWSHESPKPQGALVVTPDHLGRPLALGVVSVQAKDRYAWPVEEVQAAPSRPKPSARLTAVIGVWSERGLRVEHAYGKAAKAGIQAGDVILAVNNGKLGSRDLLSQTIAGLAPGTEVQVLLARGQSKLTLTVPLTAEPYMQHAESRSYYQSFRRDDFPVVLEHDMALWLDECGGPVIDLEGRAIGITIARVGQHGCMAIPAETVKALVASLNANGSVSGAEERDQCDSVLPPPSKEANLRGATNASPVSPTETYAREDIANLSIIKHNGSAWSRAWAQHNGEKGHPATTPPSGKRWPDCSKDFLSRTSSRRFAFSTDSTESSNLAGSRCAPIQLMCRSPRTGELSVSHGQRST